MPNSQLPERASLEFLKKLAKDRLRELRRADAEATLAAAQVGVAREHGFSSWRELKAEVDRRQSGDTALFFEACASGNLEVLRRLEHTLGDPGGRAAKPKSPQSRGTALLSTHYCAERMKGMGGAVRTPP